MLFAAWDRTPHVQDDYRQVACAIALLVAAGVISVFIAIVLRGPCPNAIDDEEDPEELD